MKFDLEIAKEQLILLFEQHFYIFADPFQLGDLPPINGEYIKSVMDFSGDINGKFIILFPEEKSKEAISNFLGIDQEDPQISTMSHFDAVSEIMNILGAHILSLWLKEVGQFKIGLPETEEFKITDQREFLKNNNITGIYIDGEPVFLKIVLN
jgi:chemotaxis protein CheY-P-specific phosphatase CheC